MTESSPSPSTDSGPYSTARASAARLAELTGAERHDVCVVLGSGWTPAAEQLGDVKAEVGFDAIGGFPPPSVAGHAGLARSVQVGERRVLVLLGRVHLYEGHDPAVVVHGVRAAVMAGCGVVVLTNAAGGLREGLRVGQPVLIADHLNLTSQSPMGGAAPPEALGPRFVDITDLYATRLRALAHDVDGSLEEGVYAALPGPHYETPAEIRMLRTMGADLVGMSTALEAIAAHHLGAEVLAISLVTNLAAGMGEKLSHAEVVQAGAEAAGRMGTLLRDVVGRLS